MKIDDLGSRMRSFEASPGLRALPGVFLVVRLDGRNFTRLTKEAQPFEAPFDARFRDLMVATADHLMGPAGLGPAYVHTQSDEISILFGRRAEPFGRRIDKLGSVLASEAGARFSIGLGAVAAFDGRVAQLPTAELAVDYFRWRAEDAARNALNAHCYWFLRRRGLDARAASAALDGLAAPAKHDLLRDAGTPYQDLPAWQKRGVALVREDADEPGFDPTTGLPTVARRRRVRAEADLPARDAYAAFVRERIDRDEAAGSGGWGRCSGMA